MDKFTLLDKTILFVGKRCSGKSVLLKELVKAEKHKFSKIFVICPTEDINRFYRDVVPENCTFSNYSDAWVEKLITECTKINNYKEKKRKHILLILDDCISDINMHHAKGIKKLFTRGRHINISICLVSQYINSVPPVVRNNSDYIFCGQLNAQSIQLLKEEYCSGELKHDEFFKLYKEATKDFSFFVVNNNSTRSLDINEIYGKIKVSL